MKTKFGLLTLFLLAYVSQSQAQTTPDVIISDWQKARQEIKDLQVQLEQLDSYRLHIFGDEVAQGLASIATTISGSMRVLDVPTPSDGQIFVNPNTVANNLQALCFDVRSLLSVLEDKAVGLGLAFKSISEALAALKDSIDGLLDQLGRGDRVLLYAGMDDLNTLRDYIEVAIQNFTQLGDPSTQSELFVRDLFLGRKMLVA